MNKFFAAVAFSALTVAFAAPQIQAAEVASTPAPAAKSEQATPVAKKHHVAHKSNKPATKSQVQKVSDATPVAKPVETKSVETKATEAKPADKSGKVEEKKSDVKVAPQVSAAPTSTPAPASTTAPASTAPATKK
jgi:hypothetical protein